MENSNIVVTGRTAPVARRESQMPDAQTGQYYPAYDAKRTGKLVDEVIAAVKDDRANTKRAISADIASTARVQNQNDRVMAACERELRRRDLPDERRDELLDRMSRADDSTAFESASSREFQREQLDHSHKLSWKILLFLVGLAVGGIGSTALVRAAA
ncbi:hypothetical protein [Acutalibacter sp. 1XD8-36]|uniref:hypothetical protein n=1 Tax=Acutalibacter sp. 1XD8-36 TaxID=2320852 RepID=UPI0014121A65|nr:hypothetical protein [Acutalibacter sp. 1XD8-36]NBJ90757.1 hypothetical protein [Acutalibacter sp. 1XD8-36]